MGGCLLFLSPLLIPLAALCYAIILFIWYTFLFIWWLIKIPLILVGNLFILGTVLVISRALIDIIFNTNYFYSKQEKHWSSRKEKTIDLSFTILFYCFILNAIRFLIKISGIKSLIIISDKIWYGALCIGAIYFIFLLAQIVINIVKYIVKNRA